MFGNFIYFILVLLIYLTYPQSPETHFDLRESLLLLGLISVAFAGFARLSFRRIERQADRLPFYRLDRLFQSALLRCSVLAVVVFAIDVYGLSLPSFLAAAPLVSRLPTLQAALFLGLFLGYLCLTWFFAFDLYRRLYRPDFSRGEYIGSNVSFSIPVLLPWLLVSGLADLLHALPFPTLKRFLAATEGQLAYMISVLVCIALLGPLAIQFFWRCKPLETGAPRRRIEELCRRAQMAYADILTWPLFGGKMVTAGVMGLVRRFRYILVTPALLSMLQPEEIDAVIAHEIGHIKRRHLVFYLFFFAGYLLLSYVAFDSVLSVLLFFEPVWWLVHDSGLNQTAVMSVAFGVMVIAVFLIYFRYIFGYFMRNFERQADTYVYALFDSAAPLMSTLRKIALTSGQSDDRPNWHHFSIRERIEFLSRCESDPQWVRRHDAKVRRSVGVYLAAVALLGVLGYQLHMGSIGNTLNAQAIEKVVRREIERTPDNAHLYSLLGDLNYRRKDYAAVREAYESSLALKPDSPQVMNNLAWLLATCEDETLRDPPRALGLARRAAEMMPSAHILDTLAESYFANGRFAEAVEAARRALAEAKGDRGLYESQLRKFKQALEAAGPAARQKGS
jgi:Zn-dependent protease with chaperone function